MVLSIFLLLCRYPLHDFGISLFHACIEEKVMLNSDINHPLSLFQSHSRIVIEQTGMTHTCTYLFIYLF